MDKKTVHTYQQKCELNMEYEIYIKAKKMLVCKYIHPIQRKLFGGVEHDESIQVDYLLIIYNLEAKVISEWQGVIQTVKKFLEKEFIRTNNRIIDMRSQLNKTFDDIKLALKAENEELKVALKADLKDEFKS